MYNIYRLIANILNACAYFNVTLPNVGGLSIVISVSVCLSVCPFAYLKDNMSTFHQILCTCYLLPWLYRPMTTVQNDTYFWFCT